MSWPMRHLSFNYVPEKGGWVTGAGMWAADGDYKDPMTFDQVIAIVDDPRTEFQSASVFVLDRRICDYSPAAKVLSILRSFPRQADLDLSAARSVLEAWQPRV